MINRDIDLVCLNKSFNFEKNLENIKKSCGGDGGRGNKILVYFYFNILKI